MLHRLIDAEYIAGDVEFATRGLYWTNVKWGEKVIKSDKPLESITKTYLNIDISFQETPVGDVNGEAISINTETGAITW